MPFRKFQRSQFAKHLFTQTALQQSELRKWQTKNFLLSNCSGDAIERRSENPCDGTEHHQDNMWIVGLC